MTPVNLRKGDYVLKKRPPQTRAKLVTKWLDRMLGPYRIHERVAGTENRDLFILEDVHTGAKTAPTNKDTLVPLDWYGQVLREEVAERGEPP